MKWLAASLLAGLALAGCVPPPPPMPAAGPGGLPIAPPTPDDPLALRIDRNLLGVLEEGLAWYEANVTDYTCVLYKQERMDPAGDFIKEQKLVCKFRDSPFSVFTHAVVNPRGAGKALYVEGEYGNMMLVQPTGLGGLLGTLKVEPQGHMARSSTLRFIDQFGFKRSIEAMLKNYRIAQAEKILRAAVVGQCEVDGRSAVVFDTWVTEPRPSGRFDTPHVRVALDRQWLLPTAVTTWDTAGIERGRYRYADVRFNVGLTDADFTPQANGMRPPTGGSARGSATGPDGR